MNNIKIEENKSLAPYTTLKIGGRARFFASATSVGDVVTGVRFAADRNLPLFILGGGSNILVSDDGFDGLVLQIGLLGIDSSEFRVPGSESESVLKSKLETRNSKLVTVAAGEDWDAFVIYCVDRNYAGVECMSGIPGLVGGTPVQNVGAYGQEVSETIVAVNVFDRKNETIRTLSNSDCEFAYRTSIFNTTSRDRYIVLSVTFVLVEKGEPIIKYRDLRDQFSGRAPTLQETRDAVLDIRRSKSMVIDPDDQNSRSAGSFFKNPIVSRGRYDLLVGDRGDVPSFPAGDQNVKVPAAWLIEHAGFQKGFMVGNVGISSNHTLAIVNRGNASASEVIALKEAIQSAVKAKFDIDLQPEPIFVGF